jgi:hypothetical protein
VSSRELARGRDAAATAAQSRPLAGDRDLEPRRRRECEIETYPERCSAGGDRGRLTRDTEALVGQLRVADHRRLADWRLSTGRLADLRGARNRSDGIVTVWVLAVPFALVAW